MCLNCRAERLTATDTRRPLHLPLATLLHGRSKYVPAQQSNEPHLFGKMENFVCGPYDEIVVPAGRDMVDYEAELVIVFGRTCKQATAADAWGFLQQLEA